MDLPVDGVNQDVLDVPIGEIVGDVRLVVDSFRVVLMGVELHFSIAFRPRRVRWEVGVLSMMYDIFHHFRQYNIYIVTF